ncbi:hypothetical protein BC834DRAFT_844657 [Gloeopeniophorella convolvens]|nr:hypothetical protein BC834DRAFT_844657 [Gloeopeniophorella convolvens]
MDWISGSMLAVASVFFSDSLGDTDGSAVSSLYWVGLYEGVRTPSWDWFFHVDLVWSIRYFIKRFVGGAAGVLFTLRGILSITSLVSLPIFLLAHFLPGVSLDTWALTYIGLAAWAYALWFGTRRFRAQGKARRRIKQFLDDYRVGSALPDQYAWSGAVGATLGFFFGLALVSSPLSVAHHLLS